MNGRLPKVTTTCPICRGTFMVHQYRLEVRPGLTCSPRCAGVVHAAAMRAQPPSSAKLNAERVRQIRRDAAEGQVHRDIALRYGVSPSTVGRVVNRKLWGHVV